MAAVELTVNGTTTTVATLQYAIDQVKEAYDSTGITIKLTSSESLDASNSDIYVPLTLDFNGNQVELEPSNQGSFAWWITPGKNKGVVTFKDSSGTGKGGITAKNNAEIYFNDVTAVIESGTYTATADDCSLLTVQDDEYSDGTNLTISGGTFIADGDVLMIKGIRTETSVNLTGGTFTSESSENAFTCYNANLTVGADVEFSSVDYSGAQNSGIAADGDAVLDISAITPETHPNVHVTAMSRILMSQIRLAPTTGLQITDATGAFATTQLKNATVYMLKDCHTIFYHSNYESKSNETTEDFERVDVATNGKYYSDEKKFDFSKDGYIFDGWYLNANGSGNNVANTSIGSEDVPQAYHVYAKWVEAEASVTSGNTTVEYATVQDAINAAQDKSGSTVKLLTDVKLANHLTITKGTFYFDLAGWTLTSATPRPTNESVTGLIQVTENTGTETVVTFMTSSTDSNKPGTIDGNGWAAVSVTGDATVNITGGIYTDNSASNPAQCIMSASGAPTVNISGGTFGTRLTFMNPATVNISDGTFNEMILIESSATYNVTGGTFKDDTDTTDFDVQNGTLNMRGHTNPVGIEVHFYQGSVSIDAQKFGYELVVSDPSQGTHPFPKSTLESGNNYVVRSIVNVTFHYNDGTNNTTVKQAFTGGPVEMPKPTRAGYEFAGWAYNNNADPKDVIAANTPFSTTADLYAVWAAEQVTYTIRTFVENLEDNYIEESTVITVPAFAGTKTDAAAHLKEREGFTLGLPEDVTVTGDGKTELQAYYNRNTYNLTIDHDNGTDRYNSTRKFEQSILDISPMPSTPPNEPTKEGFVHAGWLEVTKDESTGEEVTTRVEFPTTMPARDLTLRAQWGVNASTMEMYGVYRVLHFQENLDGTYTDVTDYTKPWPSAKIGETVSAQPNTYEGFKLNRDKTVDSATLEDPRNSLTTLSFYYDREEIKITVDLGGDDVVIRGEYGEEVDMPTPSTPPNKPDYEFDGWQDQFGRPVTFPMTMPSEDLVIRPVWIQVITVFEGQQAVMTADVTDYPRYDWFRSSDGGKTWEKIDDAADATYTSDATRLSDSGTLYGCMAIDSDGQARNKTFRLNVLSNPELPKTGDDSHIGLWLALAALSMIGVCVLSPKSEKQKS